MSETQVVDFLSVYNELLNFGKCIAVDVMNDLSCRKLHIVDGLVEGAVQLGRDVRHHLRRLID